ncbi:MAG: 5-bromo-4-chloroindolyl phosphate hydrolysis family protein [Mobilitalea sp.]
MKSKSVMPIYSVGFLWIIYALLFPLYRLTDYFIVVVLSLFLYLLSAFAVPTLFARKVVKDTNTGDTFLDEMLVEALDNVEKIRLIQNTIWKESIRKYIENMMNDTQRIIEYVKKNPDKSNNVSQFFYYYLPETVKIINSYKELETLGQAEENQSMTILKTEEFMSELVMVYHKILDDVYEDKMLETSINIDVMKKMLQQDSYLKK